jgi:uncharacterized protein (TIGR02302 family)
MVLGLFLLLALLDLLPLLPGWLHLAFLIGFAIALAYALGRIWPALRFPTRVEGIRRLERVNALVHRPLTGLADALATSATDPAAAALWEQYRRRLARMLGSLRIGRPQPGLTERDPMAFRALLGLGLAVALIGTWDHAPERLRRALLPDLNGLAAGAPVSLTVSVTPPAYTGIAPIYLESGNAAAPAAGSPDNAPAAAPTELKIPQGSTVLALVQGGREAPELRLGETATPFTPVETETYQIKTEIKAGNRLAVAQGGHEIAAWPITVIPDQPPSVAFAAPPAAGERRALRLAYSASDDYGLSSVTATIRRVDGKTGPGKATQIELSLPLPSLDAKKAEQVSYHDLTPHPWAGLPVEIQLTAKDAPGQTTTTEPVQIVLPEREFRNPVARAIIEQRKRLILEPQERLAVSRALYAIGAQPQLFNDDIVVVLGLRVAQRRLVYEPAESAVDSVQSLLWELALRVEEGELAVAERELRQLQQQLQDALANGASDEEIERLMDELQQAMDKFMQALVEKMQREMQQAGRPHDRGFDPNKMQVRREDLQKMLERARELAKGGARQAARDLLAQMQEMLENLQAQPFPGQQDPATAEAMQLLDDMDQLAQRQKDLLDRTFRRSQEQQDSQQGEQGQGGDPSAREQEALRRALGDVMRRYGEMMGDIPRPLGRAERAMRDASKALEQGQPGQAVEPQGQALSELQQGMQEMANSMMQQLHQQMLGQRGNDQQQGQNRDPLGRDENGMGMFDTSDVKIPEQSDVQRAKELIDELRRRSGDRERPKIERDYIERLLRQF